ncbi:MAG TPA: DUF3397 domain-containing protein [Bacillales bacterium]|nr:DUF3397 domain-containing protein [Bacillales bacterium]
MEVVIAHLFALFITVPILGWMAVYAAIYLWTGDKPRAFRRAADATTVLFIISVSVFTYEIWRTSLLWGIVLIFTVSGGLISVLQWKWAGDIQLKKLLKGMWRFNFLLFVAAYFVLLFYGIFERLIAA